jgi:hypothetical protein
MASNLCHKYPNYEKNKKENGLKVIKEFLHSVTFRGLAMAGIKTDIAVR